MQQFSLNEGKPLLYFLRGIVHHGGSLHGGHYTSYINTSKLIDDDNNWYYISDSSVSKVSIDRVKNCDGFMYFYEKI